jgi:Protein of unknown function (DUF1573)
MNRFAATLLGVMLVPALATAQEQGWASKFFNDGLNQDFGKVSWGQQLTHKFTITNIYDVPFVVESATVSCGCVSVVRPTAVIPPRGTAELEANMDTRKAPPGQIKRVNVYVRLTSRPQAAGEKLFSSTCTLTVSALPEGNVRFSMDRIALGIVPIGKSVSNSLQIEHFLDPNWKITGKTENNFPVDVTWEQVQPRQGGRVAYRVTATLKNNAPAGEFKYDVQLETSDPNMKHLPLVIDGMIQAPLAAAPNQVDLGKVKVGEVVTRAVIIRGPGKPFKITKVEGDGEGVTAKYEEDKAKVNHLLTIEFIPGKEGKLNKTLTIKTDLPHDLSATVTVEGSGTMP